MPELLPRPRRALLRRAGALGALLLIVANCADDESTQARQQRQQPQQQQPAQYQQAQTARPSGAVLTGKDALGDWTTDAPGVRRRITVADLPKPFATESVDNGPRLVARPEGAWPEAPAGFKVEEFATGLQNPRLLRVAPNGDIFVAESRAGRVRVLRARDGAGRAETSEVFAADLDRPFGIAVHPQTGELWASVNERDGLGDDLVPDYVTRVREGGFYGWPWFYLGANQDPRHGGKRADLRDRVVVPGVLIQSHSASLQMEFYTGRQFPEEFRNDAFAAQHGSWNRSRRTGYKVIRVPARDGVPTGEYEDFLVGFVTPAGDVWGRPVGVAVARDGALLVTDDESNTVWRVSYQGR